MKVLIDVLVLALLGVIIWLGFKFDVIKYQQRRSLLGDKSKYRLCNDGQWREFSNSYDSLIAENSTHPIARDRKDSSKPDIKGIEQGGEE